MKQPFRENYRVEVFLNNRWRSGRDPNDHKFSMQDLEDLKSQIERHIDDYGDLSLEYDESFICSLCKNAWDVDEETGEPLCCTAAIDEFRAEKVKTEEQRKQDAVDKVKKNSTVQRGRVVVKPQGG